MIKFKYKRDIPDLSNDMILIELVPSSSVYDYERFIYVNKRYIVNMYRHHYYTNALCNNIMHEYILETYNENNRGKYSITKDCYIELEKIFSK